MAAARKPAGPGPRPRPYRPRAAPQMSDKAFVFLELDRETGDIEIDGELTSGVVELYGILCRASQKIEERLGTPSD